MSLLVPSAGGLELLKRILYGRSGAITGATNVAPTVITSTAHGLANGTLVSIAGSVGNTAINGTFVVNNVTANTFQIASIVGTTLTLINGNGAWTSGGTWTISPMENASLKLFSNNFTPTEADTAGSYTEVANGAGYTTGGQTLSAVQQATGWAIPATVGGGGTGNWAQTGGGSFSASTNVPESTYTALNWSWTGAVTAYGYYVVGASSATIWWAERFASAPRNFANLDTLSLTPRLGSTHS